MPLIDIEQKDIEFVPLKGNFVDVSPGDIEYDKGFVSKTIGKGVNILRDIVTPKPSLPKETIPELAISRVPTEKIEGPLTKVSKTMMVPPRLIAEAATGMGQHGAAGIAGGYELGKGLVTGRGLDPTLAKATKAIEEIMGVPPLIKPTPTEAKVLEYAGKPFEMAGKGWEEIGKLTGLPYAEPIGRVGGEAAALFAVPAGLRRLTKEGIRDVGAFRKGWEAAKADRARAEARAEARRRLREVEPRPEEVIEAEIVEPRVETFPKGKLVDIAKEDIEPIVEAKPEVKVAEQPKVEVAPPEARDIFEESIKEHQVIKDFADRWLKEKGEVSFEASAYGNPNIKIAVTPSTVEHGNWKITYIDNKGPISHTEYRSYKELLDKEIVGFRQADINTIKMIGVGKPILPPEVPKEPIIVEQNSYKGQRKAALMGPNDYMLVAKGPKGEDLGFIWYTKESEGGFTVRRIEAGEKGKGIGTKLMQEVQAKEGEFKGVTDYTPEGKKFFEKYQPEKVEELKAIEPLPTGKVLPEPLPVKPEGVKEPHIPKAVDVPSGWKVEVQPNWRRTPGWKSEVDWKDKRIIFETAKDAKNVNIINHEIAHIRLEDSLGYVEKLSDSPFLEEYAKIRKEPKDTHINFIREHAAMDYGEYLTNPSKIPSEVATVFDKYFPKIPKPPVEPGKIEGSPINAKMIKDFNLTDTDVKNLEVIWEQDPAEFDKLMASYRDEMIRNYELKREAKSRQMVEEELFAEEKVEPGLFRPKPKRGVPGTFVSWIKSQGGIWDPSLIGETKQYGYKESGIVGLISKEKGKYIDELTELAKESGYLGPSATFNDFMRELDRDIRISKGIMKGERIWPGAMASVGTYDIGGGGAAAGRPKESPGRMVNIVEMPEMVELYNDLTQGKYPKIKAKLRAFRGAAAGTYQPGTEKIDLRADIFKDPNQARAVLSHEIGHLIDDLPDHILKQRGNILGRIASLKNYLKKYLEEYEGAPGLLTDADRSRLMTEARESLKLEKAKIEEQAEAFKDIKLTPEDITAIWNDVEAKNKLKPIYEFIVSLSDVEKKQIVREAMRGLVSEANQRKFRISIPIEGRPFKNWDQRLRDVFNKLVKEELEKRHIFTYDNIMGELKTLSTIWKPFTIIPGSKFTKYRFSPSELYADAMSVLFNNPALLADKAPNFYKGFFNYIHRKPEVKQVYDDIQARIGMGEETVLGHRREQVQAMFQRGEEALAELRKPEPYNIIQSLRTAFISRREGLLKLKREAQRKGVKLDPEKDPDYWTEELPYISGPIFDMVRNINNNILKPAQDRGITQSDIGEYLLYRREATERAKMANPKGYTEADALKQMDFLKNQIGEVKFNYLTDLVKKDWDIRKNNVFPILEKSKVFSSDLMDLIKNNEEYVTFQVREYLENKYGPNIAAKIYRQIGTLKEVINPLTATTIKDMSLVRMAERKMIAESVVNFLKENFPKEITPAKTKWSGKYHEIVEPTDPKLGLVAYTQDGKVTGYYVPKSIANIFSKDPYDFQPILRVLNVIQRPFKEILVSKNPGWWVWNIQRDLKALAKQVPRFNIPTAIKYAVRSLPDAYKDIFKDVSTEDVKAMYQMKALGVGRYWASSELGPESHLDKIVQSFGETTIKYNWEVLRPYKKVWEYLKAGSMLLDHIGSLGEPVTKIAAYKILKENTSLSEKEIAHLIRKRAGSPDFWEKGSLDFLYNNFFWFSNAGKEGIRASLEAAKENPGAYTWKTIKYDVLPKLLMFAATIGFFGKTAKELMDNIPERDKGNYLTIPIGLTPDNQTVYFVMPHDFQGQIIGSLLWKTLRLGKGGDIGGIIDYMAGGLPYTGVNPLLGLAPDWFQYLTGKNPYDPFRGKYVLPETIHQAGGLEALKEMLKYSSNQLGGGIVYRFKGKNVNEIKGELGVILGLPVVGNFVSRFLRVSDAGRADELRLISEDVRSERAKELVRMDNAIRESFIKPSKITKNPEDVYNLLVKNKSIQRHTYKEFLERLQGMFAYKVGSPESNAYLGAKSNEEKANIILKIIEKQKGKK